MTDLIRRSDAISIIQNADFKYPTWPHIVEAKEAMARDIKSVPTISPASLITGETSDGYHTFNELYHHRAVLFSVVCNDRPNMAWKSKKHYDGTMYDGMFIVGIETPNGQATYHYDIDPYWAMFRVPELPSAPEWDGHTPAQAIERIGNLCGKRLEVERDG
jgi:hypothetical protein